jgi:hypothetical protein
LLPPPSFFLPTHPPLPVPPPSPPSFSLLLLRLECRRREEEEGIREVKGDIWKGEEGGTRKMRKKIGGRIRGGGEGGEVEDEGG